MCVAAAIAGGAIVAGGIGAAGAKSAAGTEAGAAENAQAISQNEFNTITGQEAPYLQSGYGALSQLNYLQGIGTPGTTGANGAPPTASSSPAGGYGSLNQPFNASYMQQYSPAYQFQLQQGQQGVLNQDASSQGALSGAALKDLTSFNQNYANTAFNNAFSQYQTQQNNTYSRLAGIAQLGQAAAGQQATSGTALAGQAAQSATNVGVAQAGGTVGAANALGGGIGNATLLGGLIANQNANQLGFTNTGGQLNSALYGAGFNPYGGGSLSSNADANLAEDIT